MTQWFARFIVTTAFALGGFTVLMGDAHAAIIEIQPGDSFEDAVENLKPGDTLIVHQGTYYDAGRISITVKGTAAAPVVIKAADGEPRPHIARLSSATAQNTINIEGATYLTIRGFEISSNGGDGINMSGNPSYITLDDLYIHDIDVGVNFRSDMHHINVRRNQIHRTGADGGTGEGMYVGCNYAACIVSDSVIEGNWIYDTRQSTQGDGIEIKRGSHSNVIRDNVIHDTGYPCILLYGTEGNPRNVVEGNVMWNCGDAAMQVAADTIIRNNILFANNEGGLTSQDHQGVTPANLEFVHNTIVGGNPCVRLDNWDNKPGLVFANNAVYCPTASFLVSALGNVFVSGNVLFPATAAFPGSGYTVGRSVSLDFIDANVRNVYPSADSRLIDAGDAAFATVIDFNATPRTGKPDAGAYNWTGAQNPGWIVTSSFKDAKVPQAPSNVRVIKLSQGTTN